MRILYVNDGDRDEPLRAIITRVGAEITHGKFPVYPDKLDPYYQRPTRGYGWVERVLKDLQRLKEGLETAVEIDTSALEYDFVVAAIDCGAPNLGSCRQLARRIRAILGVAHHEFEAWILGDRLSLRVFLQISAADEESCQAAGTYHPERDSSPKNTLDCLALQSLWGKPWDENLSAMLANEWEGTLDLAALARSCPRGFRPFVNALARRMAQEIGVLGLQQW
jgi:hypothetical protein